MTATGAFYVESADQIGVGQGVAGGLLALGSAFGVVGRFLFAWRLGEHRRPFLAVTALTTLGAVGTLVISTGATGLVRAIGTAVAFGAGWDETACSSTQRSARTAMPRQPPWGSSSPRPGRAASSVR